ncbi:MAG: DUF1549 domain-containing protein [Pirellulaceae bacterium]|nr:DUF1549 domain-containing protein [Pirellulaceae bacterium]
MPFRSRLPRQFAFALCWFLLIVALHAGSIWAAEPVDGSDTNKSDRVTPSAAEMAARVDELLQKRLTELGWQAAGQCDDASFIRRASLDLTGTAPVGRDVLDFIDNPSKTKRKDLVARLLSSPKSSVHLANIWSSWLLPEADSPEVQFGRGGLQTWLRSRFAENLRYDRLVSDLLVSTGSITNSPTAFFVALESKPEKIAAKTARVFMGLQLDCAECHNHPFDDWKQRDFWGFAAYFSQVSTGGEQMFSPNQALADVSEGEVKLPGTEEVIAPKPLVETEQAGLETGTRRQKLTLWLTARENPFLARAAVNRVWAILFGRGLIEPIDDMRSIDIASHPELLRELSMYFAETGYDLRGLLAMLASTDAYNRANVHSSGQPPEASYATMACKPLTSTQMAASISQVARQLARENDPQSQQALMAQLGKLRGDASQATLGMVQALVTLHGTAFDEVSSDSSSRLLQALNAPHMNDSKRLQWLFLSTLNRNPTKQEDAAFSSVINEAIAKAAESETSDKSEAGEKQEAKPATWQSDLLWALINSTEFAMTP